MLKIWSRWIGFVDKSVIGFTAVLMGLMAIFVSYQVFSRYVLRFSPYWTEEIATTVMMWAGLLGAASGIWNDSHMELEMVVRHFPKALQLWFRVLSDCLIAAFAAYLLFDGIRLVQLTMNGVMASVPVPIGYSFLVVPIAGGLMVVFAVTKACDRIFRFYAPRRNAGGEVNVHG